MSLSQYLVAGAAATYAVCQKAYGAAYRLFFIHPDKQDDRPPSPQPAPHVERQPRQSVDSSQRDHASAEISGKLLRARADREGDLMAQCFKQSKEVYVRGDHARAKKLSEDGERHKLKMERIHALASAAIFKENNQGKAPCVVDLHGLRVKEAVNFSEKAVKEARWRADPEVRLIVGQGNHSDAGVARLKPAVQEALQSCGYHIDVDPRNAGVLIVRLGERR